MCAAPVAIKGCCGVHAGLPGTKRDQIPRVPGGKRCGTSPTWLQDDVMKVGYVRTSNAKRRGEMRAPPAEKRTAAARASRCTRPRSYTGPGAGCLAPPEPRPHIPARPLTTRNAKPSGTKRWIAATRELPADMPHWQQRSARIIHGPRPPLAYALFPRANPEPRQYVRAVAAVQAHHLW